MEKFQFDEELETARHLQSELLPGILPDLGEFTFAAHLQPSRALGGDLYDVIPISDKQVALIIADASGHGISSAIRISQIQAILKSDLTNQLGIEQTMQNLNHFLKRHTPARNFATLFYGVLNYQTGVLQYSNAGHNKPISIKADRSIDFLDVTGPALGLINENNFKVSKVHLEPGTLLLLYTDGLIETMNNKNKEFGEQRLADSLQTKQTMQPQKVIEAIVDEVDNFGQGQFLNDDRTLLLIKYKNN